MATAPQQQAAPLTSRLAMIAQQLESRFLGKEEVIRLLLIATVAGEHAVLIGPPGTAKSALIRTFAKLLQARYFEYLLTRFTEPNEIFGPVDIAAFREGRYVRRIESMLPDSEIVFLDEVFKSNSAILNALLTLLNERKYTSGGQVLRVPILSCFGASNEVPNDETLTAIFDRFLLRIRSDNLDAYHFQDLLQKGLDHEILQMTDASVEPLVSARELAELQRGLLQRTRFGEDFFSRYKGLVFQIRAEGVSLSDRRVVKLLKLFAASAIVDGRDQANDSDFFILKHIWNNLDQTEILEEIVGPVVDRWYRDHPTERRFAAGQVGLDELLGELQIIRELLTSGEALSDIQLFSQLKNLNEIKAALQAVDSETARRMVAEVDALLENVFASSKFG